MSPGIQLTSQKLLVNEVGACSRGGGRGVATLFACSLKEYSFSYQSANK
jgi:hypothetical protein